MVIVKYFALGKPKKHDYQETILKKVAKYIVRYLITVFVFIQLLRNRIQFLFSFCS